MNKEIRKALFILNAARLPYKFIDEFREHDPAELWSEEELWEKLNFPEGVRRRLTKIIESRWAEKEIERMRRSGARFISIDDEGYPEKLKETENPPLGLYVRGNWRVDRPSVAIVGTRKASAYGKRVAETLGSALAGAGQDVISGGAAGIDGAAHSGCAESGGRTIAVLGTGVDVVYPEKHGPLFEKIMENGAIVSEYPFGAKGAPWHFPERNRIIVGLSDRIVVVEAPDASGAMITARLALEAGREIWSVPGQITDRGAHGTNGLLRDGAQPLIDIAEFIETISGHGKQMFLDFSPDKTNLSPKEEIILKILRDRGQRTIDDIALESGFNLPEIQFCLTSLIASQLVFAPGPGRFSAGIEI